MEQKVVGVGGGGDDAVTNVKVNGTKSCISIVVNVYWVQPLRVLFNPSDWLRKMGRNTFGKITGAWDRNILI